MRQVVIPATNRMLPFTSNNLKVSLIIIATKKYNNDNNNKSGKTMDLNGYMLHTF